MPELGNKAGEPKVGSVIGSSAAAIRCPDKMPSVDTDDTVVGTSGTKDVVVADRRCGDVDNKSPPNGDECISSAANDGLDTADDRAAGTIAGNVTLGRDRDGCDGKCCALDDARCVRTSLVERPSTNIGMAVAVEDRGMLADPVSKLLMIGMETVGGGPLETDDNAGDSVTSVVPRD